MKIQFATLADIPKIAPTLLELRPHLNQQKLEEMLPVLFAEGFQLIYLGNEEIAYSVAGFRIQHFLFSGKTLYVDDLVTHSAHKKQGYAKQLLDFLKEYAQTQQCDHFSLDSGYGRSKEAYKFYLNFGLQMVGTHFGRNLDEF